MITEEASPLSPAVNNSLPPKLQKFGFLWRYPLLWVLGLAALLRLPVLLFNDSLRLDEGFSLRFIQPSSLEIVQQATNDSHPPLYSLLLKQWCSLFGTSEIAARSFSVVFGLVAIVCLYELGRQVYNPRTGLWAAGLAAVAPLWVWYSAETRMYTLWLTFGCIHSLFFFHLVKRPGFFWVLGYALSGALLIYTQYIGVLVTLTHLGFLILTWKQHRRLLWWLGQAYCLIAIAMLPWVMAVLTFYTGFDSDQLPPPTFRELFHIITQLCLGYITDNPVFAAAEPVIGTLLLGVLLIILVVLLPVFVTNPKVTPQTRLFLIAPFVWTGAFFLLSFKTSVMEVRYLLFLSPFIYMVVGHGLQQAWLPGRRLRVGLIAGIILLSCAGAIWVQTTDPYNQQRVNYREAASYLKSEIQPDDTLVLDAYFIEPAFNYYYQFWPVGHLVYAPSRQEAETKGPAFVAQRLNPPPGTRLIWVIQSYWERPANPTTEFLSAHYDLLQSINFSPELRLLVYSSAVIR